MKPEDLNKALQVMSEYKLLELELEQLTTFRREIREEALFTIHITQDGPGVKTERITGSLILELIQSLMDYKELLRLDYLTQIEAI